MIDHLVFATDDLERTTAQISAEWGVTPTPGGAHVGRGTRNELVAIGGGSYLELIGPDLAQAGHHGARPFGIDGRRGERLIAWCARPDADIGSAAAAARLEGHDIGPITSMSRARPDGVLLEWQLSIPPLADERPDEPAVLPFVIDWLGSEHPTASLHHPVELVELQLHTPDLERVRAVIDAIGVDRRITVHRSPDVRNALFARLHTPAGDVTLSG
jgi:hypothetical protein